MFTCCRLSLATSFLGRAFIASILVGFLFASSAHAGPVELRLLCWDGDDSMGALRTAASEFEAAHKGIKVRVETVTANYQEKLLAQFAAGVAPDVVMMDPQNFEKFSKRGALLPLNGFIEKTHYDIGAYYPNIIDAHSLNRKLYVLPRDIAPMSIIYYNKRMFDEARIPYPDGSWTWDFHERPELKQKDFLWVMHRLTKLGRNGEPVQWGFAPGSQDLLWWTLALSSGGRWADDYRHPKRLTYDSPKMVQAIQFSADLALKYKWMPSVTEISSVLQSNARQVFTQGKVAMFQSGIWEVPSIRKELVKGRGGFFEWDIAMAPGFRDGVRKFATGGSGYAIMGSTKHPFESWQLTSWMGGRPGMKLLATTGLAQPAIRQLARSEPWLPGPNTPPDQQYPANRIVTDQSVPYVVFGPLGSEWQEVNSLATAPFSRIWDGSSTAMQVVPAANRIGQERLDYLLKQRDLKPFDWRAGGLAGLALFGVLAAWVYAPERKKQRTIRQRSESRMAYLFVLPWLLGLICFTAGPMILSLLMSFADWDIIQPAKWRGLGNYGEAFTVDPRFWISLKVTLIYTVVAVPVGIAASLALALLLNVKVRGISIWRTCYYLPSVASGVAASLIWRRIFMPDGGLINAFIYGPSGHGNFLGLATLLKPWAASGGQVNWLGSEALALPALILMSLWGAGAGMIVLLAGLQGVPTYYYEAATLDGASAWTSFRKVTLPLISPTLFFCLITGSITTFQVFTQALLMTNGGPNDSTLFFGLHMYNNGFSNLRMGYASAMAWVMFAVVLLFTAAQLRVNKWVYYEASR